MKYQFTHRGYNATILELLTNYYQASVVLNGHKRTATGGHPEEAAANIAQIIDVHIYLKEAENGKGKS